MELRIENSYSDGHESRKVHVLKIEPAVSEIDNWWEDVAYLFTGDGHGLDHPGLGSCYTATIIAADNAALVGRSNEWVD